MKKQKNIETKFEERLRLLMVDPTNPILKVHSLRGKLNRYKAFSVAVDLRVIFEVHEEYYYLIDTGLHHQVY